MAASNITVVVTDKRNGSTLTLQDVNVSITSEALKANYLVQRVKDLPADKMLLYLGPTLMQNHKTVAEYNKSKRTKLNLFLVELQTCTVKIKCLQGLTCGEGCVCVPLWAFCCRQTFPVEVANYHRLSDLKAAVVDELGDPNMSYEKLKLRKGPDILEGDSSLLADIGIVDGTTLTLLVKPCWFRRGRPQRLKGGVRAASAAQVIDDSPHQEDTDD